MPYFLAIFFIAVSVVLGINEAHWPFSHHSQPEVTQTETVMPPVCDNAHFVQDREWFESRTSRTKKAFPEHVCGVVVKVYAARHTKSGEHGYFIMHSDQGDAYIRIVSNLDEIAGGEWPWVHEGDKVDVEGRYYYSSKEQQGIDWTHRGASNRWPWPGFVKVNGQLHQ